VNRMWLAVAALVLAPAVAWGLGEDDARGFPPAAGQATQARRPWYQSCLLWSSLSFAGAHAADAWSSWQLPESNPVLRSAGGRFGARGMTLKFSFAGSYLLLQNLVVRKHPESRRAWCGTSFAGTAVVGGTALRNRLSAP